MRCNWKLVLLLTLLAHAKSTQSLDATALCSSSTSGGVSAGNGLSPTALVSFQFNPAGTGSFTVSIFNNLRTFTTSDCTNLEKDTSSNTFYVQLVCATNSGPPIIGNLQVFLQSGTGATLPPLNSIDIPSRQTVTNLLVAPNAGQYIGNTPCTLNLLADFYAQDPATKTCVTCGAKLIASQNVGTGPSSIDCNWFNLQCYTNKNELAYSSFFYFLLTFGEFLVCLGVFLVIYLRERAGPYKRIAHEVTSGNNVPAALAILNGTYTSGSYGYTYSGAQRRKKLRQREIIDTPSEDDEELDMPSSSSSSAASSKPVPISRTAGPTTNPLFYALNKANR